jgi:GcrA cell cycle regulator
MSEQQITAEAPPAPPPEWTEDRTDTLRVLWQEGLTTREIGARMGITKNAVVGKVHRLGLPKRQSPIAPKEPPAKVIRLESLSMDMCSWPFGEPGTAEFRFCGRTAVHEKPYCPEHCARAYVRVTKDRKGQSAAA